MEPLFEIDPVVLKYIRQEDLSPEEIALLHRWMDAMPGRKEMLDKIKAGDEWMMSELHRMQSIGEHASSEKVIMRLQQEGEFLVPDSSLYTITTPRSTGRSWSPWLAAASVIVILVVGGWWVMSHRSSPAAAPVVVAPAPADVQPGGNRAVLTLADGRKISLDSSANGVLATQQNTTVSKLPSGQLTYQKATNAGSIAQAYNVLSTPKAGQFALTLADGTHVWLNNASTLHYPVAFTGAGRQVELTGEAYFEVAKDATHPFRVLVHRGSPDVTNTVEVLGTSFNVMAYGDEPDERTTLLSGSVRCVIADHSTLLRPNEQSVLSDNGALHVITKVNTQEVIAWKNGYFHFDHSSLENTMRQLARWYDVDVRYEGRLSSPQDFSGNGKIQRNLTLSTIMHGLENDHVHFKLQGRTLIVMQQ